VVLDLGEGLAPHAELSLACTAFPGPHWPGEGRGWSRRVIPKGGSRWVRYAGLFRFLRAWRPDVVHSHQEAWAPLLAAWAGVPVRVETVHSGPFWRQFGQRAVRERRRRAVTQHVAVSAGLREELIAAGDLQRDEVTAIPNGVRIGSYRAPHAQLQAPIIGTVARFDADKGLDHLVRAFAEIRREWPGARLILAGEGPYRPALEALIGDLDLGTAVELPGHVADLRTVWRRLDLFVLPSLHEAFGLALAEAMAEGVPVVASNLPGPASLCADGREGLLVPPGDAAPIAEACRRLLRDAELRARLSRAAYQRVRADFSLAGMCEAHLQLYRTLLERKGMRQ